MMMMIVMVFDSGAGLRLMGGDGDISSSLYPGQWDSETDNNQLLVGRERRKTDRRRSSQREICICFHNTELYHSLFSYWTLRNFFSWQIISSSSGWQSRSMMSSCSSPSVSDSLSGLETASRQGRISFMIDKCVTRENMEEKTLLEPEIFTSVGLLNIK